MKRILFTGAQGTGKTTILNEYKDSDFKLITEVVRNLSKKKVKINQDGDEKSQKLIFKTYKELLSKNVSYISDRSLVDVVAYTMYLSNHNKLPKELTDKQIKAIQKFNRENPDVVYCYYPIEFDVVPDGVRSTDEEFRKEIDDNIKEIMRECDINPVIVEGDVENRKNIVNNLCVWMELCVELFINNHEEFLN